MKKRALAVMLAGALALGAQTGVWAASDTSDQKEGELTLLMVNDWIDETGAKGEEFTKVIKQYEEEILARLQKKLNISLAEAQEYVKKFGRKNEEK